MFYLMIDGGERIHERIHDDDVVAVVVQNGVADSFLRILLMDVRVKFLR